LSARTSLNPRSPPHDHRGRRFYFHEDDLGNTLALTDSKGNVMERCDYDDYGMPEFLSAEGLPLSATTACR